MIVCDVNVLVYAHREDASAEHAAYAAFVIRMATGQAAFGLAENVLAGFVRVVTNPRVFKAPTPPAQAIAFCTALRERPQAVALTPGPRAWDIFVGLCEVSGARGKLVADAWHAALAIANGATWITTDSDFARFPDLDWRHPLA